MLMMIATVVRVSPETFLLTRFRPSTTRRSAPSSQFLRWKKERQSPMQARPRLVLFLFLASTLSLALPVAQAEDSSDFEYEETARVARITLTRGEVSLLRAGDYEWEHVSANVPLVEGDTLATGRDSRLEVQIDARNFVRIGPESVLKIETLRDEGVALSLKSGTLVARLSRYDPEREYFEIDAPKTTVALQKTGLYRLDVDEREAVRVVVREEGLARVYSETWGFILRDERSARLIVAGYARGDWELGRAPVFDEWDSWNRERERYLAGLLRHDNRERYYDPEVWGAEELDHYGSWIQTREYGYVWRPHVTVIKNYYDWAPYRYGQWRWCPPYGWTWIPDEEWGWATYHYGRWVYVNNAWCWAPRGYGYAYRRAWWRPALVAFVYIPTSYGEHLAWYPLTYGQRDPRSRNVRRRESLTPLRASELSNLRRANPALLRAVTTVPARDFGTSNARARVAETDVARRALTNEPVRGRLPVTQDDVRRVSPPGGARTHVEGGAQSGTRQTRNGEGLSIVRPAPVRPPRVVPEVTTGAATRTPGLPLDNELQRRVRIRSGQPSAGINTRDASGDDAGDDSNLRVRPPRSLPPETRRPGTESEGNPARRVRPPGIDPTARPPQDEGDTRPPQVRRLERDTSSPAPTRVRPVRPPDVETDSPSYPPPEPRDTRRVEPTERREPPRRVDPPARDERPASNDRPAPREEPRSAPPETREPTRSAPPPPREESPPPRNTPPPREDRPEPRQERPSPPASSESRERSAPPVRPASRPDRQEVDDQI